ncbi:MAG: fluoride efflux transporter CrcB [Alphaproteobacteria bacterium]|nr:MAG: fluoride efflux transporter CrcB [Alphaproteobacteria bacterium]
MIWTVMQVAAGGAVGASARYLLGVAVFRLAGPGFPLGVLAANILGCFAMGFLVSVFALRGLTHLNPLVMTGLLGGFTTFSSFSLEAVTLYERGELGAAAFYVGVSVGVGILALLAGLWLGRSLAP